MVATTWIPPVWLSVRIGWFFLPLPVVLVWPLILVMVLIAMPILAVVPIRGFSPQQRALLPIWAVRMLSALRGLDIDVAPKSGPVVRVVCR